MKSKRRTGTGKKRAMRRGHWRQAPEGVGDGTFHWCVRDTLASGGPTRLLSMVSFMMAIDDPRPMELFDRSKRSEWAPIARRKFVDELLADSAMEASALLAVLGEFMDPDDEMVAVVRAELSIRPPRRPHWLDRLGQTRIHRAVRVSHELDRVDMLLLEGCVPGTHGKFTCEVTIAERFVRVREADLHAGGIDELLATLPTPEFRREEVELADVRARLTRAIDGEANLPPIKSETWPHHRALVEWLIRKLPDDGSAEPRPELADIDVDTLADGFYGSHHGRPFERHHRPMVESLIEFGAETGMGDPMRWSTWRAHQWLFDELEGCFGYDWLHNTEAGPKLLQAFVTYSHDVVGIRREVTAEVLAAIESWVPEYQRALRSKLA